MSESHRHQWDLKRTYAEVRKKSGTRAKHLFHGTKFSGVILKLPLSRLFIFPHINRSGQITPLINEWRVFHTAVSRTRCFVSWLLACSPNRKYCVARELEWCGYSRTTVSQVLLGNSRMVTVYLVAVTTLILRFLALRISERCLCLNKIWMSLKSTDNAVKHYDWHVLIVLSKGSTVSYLF